VDERRKVDVGFALMAAGVILASWLLLAYSPNVEKDAWMILHRRLATAMKGAAEFNAFVRCSPVNQQTFLPKSVPVSIGPATADLAFADFQQLPPGSLARCLQFTISLGFFVTTPVTDAGGCSSGRLSFDSIEIR
jgi:hypothetical protein